MCKPGSNNLCEDAVVQVATAEAHIASLAHKLRPDRILARVHRDQRGTISIVSVFCLLMFTMLLIMIVNVGRHVDDKVKMQNAADASVYSGGVVLARGMNGIAFSNHLLCDVFAITAFLREGRDRNAEQLTPEILDAWENVGVTFSQAEFDKFNRLGRAIIDKVPKERELVESFGEMTAAASEFALPVFEYILREELIPYFERTLVRSIPELAQQAANDIAERHGRSQTEQNASTSGNPRLGKTAQRSEQQGVLWRMNAQPVGYPSEEDPMTRTMPVVDPTPSAGDFMSLTNGSQYFEVAVKERRRLAKLYLDHWNFDKLSVFFRDAKMSQFGNLWRIATCAQLDRLLQIEYPETNLPMIIRQTPTGEDLRQMRSNGRIEEVNEHLNANFQFLSIVYRTALSESGPGLFKNPLTQQSDAMTFAQVTLFVPQPRRVPWFESSNSGNGSQDTSLGGTFGFDTGLTAPPEGNTSPPDPETERWVTERWPRHWDTFNQNWMVQIVPATATAVPELLQTIPTGHQVEAYRPLDMGSVTTEELKQINTH